MKHVPCRSGIALALAAALLAGAAQARAHAIAASPPAAQERARADVAVSTGAVTIGGKRVDFHAYTGTIDVYPRPAHDYSTEQTGPDATRASMFYIAYFRDGVPSADRPITFLYNGGPGSATFWLQMGAFGPKRILLPRTPGNPSDSPASVNNQYSLLDASDLVFIDAPGTGFSRVSGKDPMAFYGVDPDVFAFSDFIRDFLTTYDRWTSPKYIFGESYGTTRSGALANDLQAHNQIKLDGMIQLSQILNFDLEIETPAVNPGADQAYVVALPSLAATAYHHHRARAGEGMDLDAFLKKAEDFANTDYLLALQRGNALDPAARRAMAGKLSDFIGLPADYILKSDLRIEGGQFAQQLLADKGQSVSRLDGRVTGPQIDSLARASGYDPFDVTVSPQYVAVYNDYVRRELKYETAVPFKPKFNGFAIWDMNHRVARSPAIRGATNVMTDLARAMTFNPKLRVMVSGGYFDLVTPFYQGWFEMNHLPIPAELQKNIEYRYFASGHISYSDEDVLKRFSADVRAFVTKRAE